MVWSAGSVSTGALFTSVTITWNVFVAPRLGEPLSKTRTVTGFVLGCAGVRDEAIDPAMRLLAPLVARHARRIDGAR